jgi:hypothetical protein
MTVLNDKNNCSPHDGKHHHVRHDAHTNEKMQEDANAAREAYALWKSSDPRDWDRALDEKDRITSCNPSAWKKAMHQVDEDERRHPASQKVCADQLPVLEVTASPAIAPPPLEAPIYPIAVAPVPHPGYAQQSPFAPPVPQGPAWERAYNRPQENFYGLNCGLFGIGVKGNSLDIFANVGIAGAEFQLGQNNRISGEFLPLSPIHARAGAGIGFDNQGIHSEVGAGGNFFGINGDADFGATVGQNTGVSGDVRGNVLPVHVQAEAGADLGPGGAQSYAGANTGIANLFAVRSGGYVGANEAPGIAAGAGIQLGNKTLDIGPTLNQAGPRVTLQPGDANAPAFFPTGDRAVGMYP